MTALTLPEAHRAHREEFYRFVIEEATPWHRRHLGGLYGDWDRYNAEHFGGALVAPYILLGPTYTPRAWGDCGTHSSFGGILQIRIRETLVNGKHRHVRDGAEYEEGRRRFVTDVLLHEMIHQWQFETIGPDTDGGYHGHGPTFRDKANEIGAALGLPPVRTSKKRGPDKHLPSCAQWPHNVRPADYYLGAVVPANGDADGDDGDGDGGEAEPAAVDVVAIGSRLADRLTDADLPDLLYGMCRRLQELNRPEPCLPATLYAGGDNYPDAILEGVDGESAGEIVRAWQVISDRAAECLGIDLETALVEATGFRAWPRELEVEAPRAVPANGDAGDVTAESAPMMAAAAD